MESRRTVWSGIVLIYLKFFDPLLRAGAGGFYCIGLALVSLETFRPAST